MTYPQIYERVREDAHLLGEMWSPAYGNMGDLLTLLLSTKE